MSPKAGSLLINEIVPCLRSAVPNAVGPVGCEDAEELIQDANAMAAKLLHQAEAAGQRFTPDQIAHHTIQRMKLGWRSTDAADALHSRTRLNHRARLVSLDAPVRADRDTHETLTLGDVLSTDQEDPAMIAARNLDWSAFCATQPPQARAILRCAAEGSSLRAAAQSHRLNRSTIEQDRERLAREIKQLMGEDILRETARPPAWKDNLIAAREKAARNSARPRVW